MTTLCVCLCGVCACLQPCIDDNIHLINRYIGGIIEPFDFFLIGLHETIIPTHLIGDQGQMSQLQVIINS